MEQAIFKAKPRTVMLEDGTEITALELVSDPNVYKADALRMQVGELNGWNIYHWLSEGPQLDTIKASGGYLGATWDELPEDAYKAVMEIAVTQEVDGEAVTTRLKLVDAEAQGITYAAEDVLPPHAWEGVE